MKITKKWRKEQTRDLLDSIQVGRWFNETEVEAFNALTGFEYTRYKKILSSDPGQTSTRNIYVGDVKDTRSWLKQIDDPAREKRNHINPRQAMRKSIKNSMEQAMVDVPYCCAKCNKLTDLTIDHKTIPFSMLAEAFIMAIGTIETDGNLNTFGHQFIDKELEQQWINFHNDNADYQWLCRSCNSSKGANNDCSE